MALPRLELPAEVIEIAATLEGAGFEAWCVGGALRDRILRAGPGVDVDLATSATPEQVQQIFKRTVPVGIKFGTVGVLDRNRVLHEVTTFRKDVSTDGRHAVVEYGVSIEEDLARRDFTVNALAYHPTRHEWRDPFGGERDLADRIIRAVGNPPERFAEDYLRILRMIRFALRLGFDIDPATWAAAVAAAPGLDRLSAERVRDEWYKSLRTTHVPERLVELWWSSGAAAVWMPELRRSVQLTPGAGMDLPHVEVAMTACLAERPGSVMRRLKASNAEITLGDKIERGPRAPAANDPVSARRWLAEVGDAAQALVAIAVFTVQPAPDWIMTVAGVWQRKEATSRAQLAVTGTDLEAAGIPKGPELGRILGRLLDAVIEDPSKNSRETLLSLVRSWQ
ncbi:MAG: CCA tRNA nucleotidyltransferase [Gemmatimonadales bacterium]|nr:CCA tRNA nucleotidyltransferase [Gemmatimonadales bacterium]